MKLGLSRLALIAALAFSVAACHSGAQRVDCDKHLVPINPPAPIMPAAPPPPTK
jgi:hypothetical protein